MELHLEGSEFLPGYIFYEPQLFFLKLCLMSSQNLSLDETTNSKPAYRYIKRDGSGKLKATTAIQLRFSYEYYQKHSCQMKETNEQSL